MLTYIKCLNTEFSGNRQIQISQYILIKLYYTPDGSYAKVSMNSLWKLMFNTINHREEVFYSKN